MSGVLLIPAKRLSPGPAQFPAGRSILLIFSRQNLPFVERDEINVDDMEKGGYIMLEAPNGPSSVEVTLVATGSEVALAPRLANSFGNEHPDTSRLHALHDSL